MSELTKIYLVTNCFGDPNKIYIGKTKNCRKNAHKITYGNDITYDYIDEINSFSSKEWRPIESFWIQYFKFLGLDVLNKQEEGGSGVGFHTEESKLKISMKKTGYKYSEEHNKRISESNKGKKRTQETCNKISQSNKGKSKHTKESKEKIKDSLKGRSKPEGFGVKVALKNKGNTCGPKGYNFSLETKSKMSKSHLGKKYSLEAKNNMSLAKLNPTKCLETGIIYNNPRLASEDMNISLTSIYNVCNGLQKTAKNFTFIFIKDEFN